MKKILIIFVLLVGMSSCSPTPIENYKGGVVVSKFINLGGSRIIRLKLTEQPNKLRSDTLYYFKTIHLEDFDYKKINVGDTIK